MRCIKVSGGRFPRTDTQRIQLGALLFILGALVSLQGWKHFLLRDLGNILDPLDLKWYEYLL